MILQKIFEIPNHLRLRSGYHELFWYCETKKFRQKNVIFRSHALKVSMAEISRKVEGVTHENFQYWEAKKNQRKIAMPPTEHESFRSPKDSETQRGSPTKFIGSLREKNSTEKSDINPIGMKFLDNRTFLKYRSVPQRNLSALCAKIFPTENRDTPFFCISFFDTHLKLSETLDGS